MYYMLKKLLLISVIYLSITNTEKCFANDGYKLWLQYSYVEDDSLREAYISHLQSLRLFGDSETMNVVKNELTLAMQSLLNIDLVNNSNRGGLIVGSTSNLSAQVLLNLIIRNI